MASLETIRGHSKEIHAPWIFGRNIANASASYGTMTSKPQYIFRIDEIHESQEGEVNTDNRSHWVPPVDIRGHALTEGGASGHWWFCDGLNVHRIGGLPPNSAHYQTTTMYYNAGMGFWLSRGDATQAEPDWKPLNFDHSADYSSYVTNAGQHSCLACIRQDQMWPQMLLPDVYRGQLTPYPEHGGLKGDISILWALIAFSMHPTYLAAMIPQMFQNGVWQTITSRYNREDQRGVIVWVYTCQDPSGGPSNATKLHRYEQGEYGMYYN